MSELHTMLEAVARAFEGDADAADDAFAEDARFVENVGEPRLESLDEIRGHFLAFGGRRERFELVEVIADDRRAAVRYVLHFRADAAAYGQHGWALVEHADEGITSWEGLWIELEEDLSAWDGH